MEEAAVKEEDEQRKSLLKIKENKAVERLIFHVSTTVHMWCNLTDEIWIIPLVLEIPPPLKTDLSLRARLDKDGLNADLVEVLNIWGFLVNSKTSSPQLLLRLTRLRSHEKILLSFTFAPGKVLQCYLQALIRCINYSLMSNEWMDYEWV